MPQAEVHKAAGLPAGAGTTAAAGFESQFDELTASVDAKAQELVQTLASTYTEALKAVDAQIEEERAKNAGLVDKAISAIKRVIDTILKVKDLLRGCRPRSRRRSGPSSRIRSASSPTSAST